MAESKLKVVLGVDSSRFNAGLGKASGRLKAFGGKLKSIGSSLTTRITLPLALAGGAAIKMGFDFDKSMTKIKTLVGIAGNEVDAMGVKVKQLATQTGKSSNEAAEALFFITSAGLRGAEAMETLEQSLKASALGLGETATVADLATSAMNAYGPEVLGAADATDVLVSAVREGKLEASELSATMGQVIPVASNMGVAFHEVGGAFAAMSRTGTPAAQAATQLNAILMAMMKPSEDAKKAMKELSLSQAGLRKQIKEKGLLSVLETLKEKSIGNAMAFERVFGSTRGLKGILDLTGKSAATTSDIMHRMAESAGITSEAYKILTKSASFQLTKSLASLKNMFTEVGSVLLKAFLPAIQQIGKFILNLTQQFNKLSPKMKSFGVAIAVITAALPLLITLSGSFLSILGALISPVGLVVAGLSAIAYVVYNEWGSIKKVLVDIANYFVDLYNESLGFRLIIEGLGGIFKAMFTIASSAFTMVWNIIKGFSANLISAFQNIGKVISGVFTLNPSLIKEGLLGMKDAVFDNLKLIGTEGLKHMSDSMSALGTELPKAFKKAYIGKPLSQVIEEDLDKLPNFLKDKFSEFASIFSGGGGGGDSTSDIIPDKKKDAPIVDSGPTDEELRKMQEFEKKLLQMKETARVVGQGISDVFTTMGSNISQTLTDQMGLFGAFAGAFIETSLRIIGQKLQESLTMQAIDKAALAQKALSAGAGASIDAATTATSLAASATKATGSAVEAGAKTAAAAGPLAAFVLPALVAGAVAVVAGAFKKSKGPQAFANGGIVSGPTLGLMGEYSGAKSNPEVVAPLSKLEGMLGQKQTNVNVGGNFRIQGQDLVLALQKADKQRNRII